MRNKLPVYGYFVVILEGGFRFKNRANVIISTEGLFDDVVTVGILINLIEWHSPL